MAEKIKVVGLLKLENIPAGAATPAAPLGPALGQKKIDIRKFCKDFNDLTESHKGKNLRVKVKILSNGSYKILYGFASATNLLKTLIEDLKKSYKKEAENTSDLVKKEELLKKSEVIKEIPRAALESLAKEKVKEMNTISIESALKSLAGSALSMGIIVL